MADQQQGGRSAVVKAIELLASFTPDDDIGVGVSELARRICVPKSTAHRLLRDLVATRAVQKSHDMYRLGPLCFELTSGTSSAKNENVSELLTPFLAALFERTRQTVHLAYLDGVDVVYANKLFSRNGVDTPSRMGGRVPAHCTGVGKAIIAWDKDLTNAVITRGLTPWTPYTLTDPSELQAELVKVRDSGVAYDRQEIREGLHCIAAPVFGRGSIPVAAISVSGAVDSFVPEEHMAMLRKITASASREFRAAVPGL